MSSCIKKTMAKIDSKVKVERAGYACWAIGIALMLVYRDLTVYLFSVGIAVFGIGTGFIGLGEARKSDKRMAAMANLEFYEKIAVIESYLQQVIQRSTPSDPEAAKAYADRIYYDIKGAKQLEKWMKDPNIKRTFYEEIQRLLDTALKIKTQEDLIKRLQQILQILKEDC